MTRLTAAPHEHDFLGADHTRNERRTWAVIALTATMMVAEIIAGSVFGSMALLADGWHMATHAAALLISALAYRFARRRAHDPRFTFGTGKVGDLAGFASALILAIVALLILWESGQRIVAPVPISFAEAIAIAVLGLAVNVASAWLLVGDHGHHHAHGHHHGHGHDHGHDHDHDHGHDAGPGLLHTIGNPMADDTAATRAGHPAPADHNLRAAYLHVLTDALTSVLAIAALAFGALFGWQWLDPAIGILGAALILRWSASLMADTGRILLDCVPPDPDLPARIRAAIETPDTTVADLHVWQLGPGHLGAILAIRSAHPRPPADYRARLSNIPGLSHLTIEVEPA
jgi:cation diffusion facilitator family transporter